MSWPRLPPPPLRWLEQRLLAMTSRGSRKYTRFRGVLGVGSDEFEPETAGLELDVRCGAGSSLLPSWAVRIQRPGTAPLRMQTPHLLPCVVGTPSDASEPRSPAGRS
jgi:hypothetical protein